MSDYLLKYGYISVNTRSLEGIKRGIKNFQMFFGLLVTGELDDKTKEMMSAKRCGNKDPVHKIKVKTRGMGPEGGMMDCKGDYSLEGSKWTNYKLMYKIKEWSQK
ncbi:unnamed protein product, partial [Medioppia subpectinata]